jgi:hypothetical protein
MTVSEILGNAIKKAKYDRYLQYGVTAIDGVKVRSYKAMALFVDHLRRARSAALTLLTA